MPTNSATGVQAVERAIAMLRLLGEAGTQGLRLIDIQTTLGLTRPTAHRLLQVLVRQRLAANDPEGRRYYLGLETAILGWSATKQSFDLREVCQQPLLQIAQESGDTAILVVRSGYEAIFIDSKPGPHFVEAMTVEIGARRPLGAGATGVAILAAMPDEQVDQAFKANRQKLEKYPYLNEAVLRRAIRAAHAKGYAISEGLLRPELHGVAVPILMGARAAGAIGVATISKRLTKSRSSELGRILDTQRRIVEKRLLELRDAGVLRALSAWA